MQLYGNCSAEPVRKVSKTTSKGFYEFRVAESQSGGSEPTWYTVRLMVDKDPCLKKGDFVRVTGKLKVDYYLSRAGEPTGTLLVIAFEATKKTKTPNSEDSTPEPPTLAPTKVVQKPQVLQQSLAHEWRD